MTDKITGHPLKQMAAIAFSAKLSLATLLSASLLAQPVYAVEQEWWFDVEVILFERNLDTTNNSEKFKQSRLEQPSNDYIDLLTPYLKPDLSYLRAGLTYCRPSNQLAAKTQYEQGFAFPLLEGQINQSLSPDLKDQLEQSVDANPDAMPEENFDYKVATKDIFAKYDDKNPLTQTTDSEDTGFSNTELINNDNADPKLAAENNLPRPPIQVEFIEWQIPNEIPCAYKEQINPSFAAISSTQNKVVDIQAQDHLKRVPEVINGTEWQQKRSASLLSTSSMHMSDLYEKIKKQRDITPILHINWRQEVKFGRKNGQTIRLFAGENFADQFDANGLPIVKDTDSLFAKLNQPTDEFYIPEQELSLLSLEQQQALILQMKGTDSEVVVDDLFARIDSALADETPINFAKDETQTEQQTDKTSSAMLEELWQLDGGITVYLRNVGRVPYLHIDSDLDFRQPIFDPKKAQHIADLSNELSDTNAIAVNQLQQPNFLQSANFNQLRRVISKQVHYFDHPLFGMIVSINRYRWPEVAQPETDNE